MKNRFFKKGICVLLGIMMLLAALPMATSAAEEQRHYLKPTANTAGDGLDGGYYVHGLDSISKGEGENSIKMTGSSRCLWAVSNSILESMPYLYYKSDGNLTRMTATWYCNVEPEIDMPYEEGEHCINLMELVAEQDTIGWVYIIPYVWTEGVTATSEMEYMYLSNVDEEGNVYEKPVQPLAPATSPSMEERWQLKANTQDDVDDEGYGWLMDVNNIKITLDGDDTDGKDGFTMERAEGSSAAAYNIAWVVPYEVVEQYPYLAIEIGNEGRLDQGPRVSIYAYWEHVVGSGAYFDVIPAEIGATSLNGTTRFPLKYAVDNVKEELHGEDGIAIILAVAINERSDGTTLDPLLVENAYLYNVKEGWENYSPEDGATGDDSAPQGGNSNEGGAGDLWIIIGILGGAVVIAAILVVILIVASKKKKN
ncbi:MAG: hypothetical protein IJY82_07065 [Oscillospiraceae bacterium]|nr:hypothetical protein [Oscillospiraceae bacterium]